MSKRPVAVSRRLGKTAWVGSGLRVEVLEARRLLAQVFTVVDTLDDVNPGSLRWAIGQVNADASDTAAAPDQVQFAIPTTDAGYNATTGVWTIAPQSALPTVTRPVVVNGSTQPGAVPNSSATSDNAVLKIQLQGKPYVDFDGLDILGGDSTVEGLAMGGFFGGAIRLDNAGNDVVMGNFLGLTPAGTADSNYQGVVVVSADNTVGGPSPAARNVASTNQYEDISLVQGSPDDLVEGNFVGLSPSGTVGLGNQNTFAGIYVSGGTGIVIGGTAAGSGNVIGGESTGIFDNGAGYTLYEGNFVGTDPTGAFAIPNFEGVSLYRAGDTFGGTAPGAGNLVSGNSGTGLGIMGASELIEGNFIGTNRAGTSALGNLGPGIGMNSGDETVANNVISGNTIGMVVQEGMGDTITGNSIGTDVTGTVAIGNTSDGIQVLDDTSGASIGGSDASDGNQIAYNVGEGIRVFDTSSGVSILSNSIHDNAKLGIDLGGDGVTPNTPGGPHVGPNLFQNYPVLTSTSVSAGSTTIAATLNSTPNSVFTVQFFGNPKADNSGHGQGLTFLGQMTGIKTYASGNASFAFNTPGDLSGEFLSATATDPAGNTSEFSKDLVALPVAQADLVVSVAATTPTATVGGGVKFAFTVTNNGPDAATNLLATDVLPSSLLNSVASATLGQYSLIGNTFTDTVANLPAGASFRVDFASTVSVAGAVANTLSATADESDPSPADDSATVTIQVGPAPTTATATTLLAAPDPSSYGQPVTFTAVVSAAGQGGSPVGTVTFTVDGVDQPPATLVPTPTGNPADAFFSTLALAPGDHKVSARFNGNPIFDPSASPAITQTVNPAATTTTLSATPNPSPFGQAVTFKAVVSPAGQGGSPVGVVTFSIDGVDQTPVSVTGTPAQAFFTTTALAVGGHRVTAHFDGLGTFSPSDAPALTEVISPLATTTTLVGTPNPAAFGQPVTFTATVGSGTSGFVPTGTVTFTVDGVASTAPLTADGNGVTGTATFTVPAFVAGNYKVSAHYNGDAHFGPDDAPAITQVVTLSASATTLVVEPNPSVEGQPVTLRARVTGPDASGTVTFLDGVTTLGQTATGPDGQAVLVIPSLSVGSHDLSARFAGSGNASGSSSGVVTQVVSAAQPTGDGPKVVSVVRFGYHRMRTKLVLGFDEPLDAPRAQDPANYRLVGPGGRPIRVVAALGPDGESVALNPDRLLNLHWRYVLTVIGTPPAGLANTAGQALDGSGSGQTGTDFVTTVTISNLGGPNPRPSAVAKTHEASTEARDRLEARHRDLAISPARRLGRAVSTHKGRDVRGTGRLASPSDLRS